MTKSPPIWLRRRLCVLDAAVLWPTTDDPIFPLVDTVDRRSTNGFASSDHRLVRVDLTVPGTGRPQSG